MLTGEYFVLDGAKTLAVPTVLGQSFQCIEEQNTIPLLIWNAFHLEKLWLSFTVNYRTWEIIATNDIEATDFIVNTLKIIQKNQKQNSKKIYNILFLRVWNFPLIMDWEVALR